ncbi:hypothetical protein EDC04DRAFT_1682211 [Pisolithus marmoratus]|nr:hypothetical protein EDC04DRAFT_1682211 [Pisolithus marmoratus]
MSRIFVMAAQLSTPSLHVQAVGCDPRSSASPSTFATHRPTAQRSLRRRSFAYCAASCIGYPNSRDNNTCSPQYDEYAGPTIGAIMVIVYATHPCTRDLRLCLRNSGFLRKSPVIIPGFYDGERLYERKLSRRLDVSTGHTSFFRPSYCIFVGY